jgi:phenylacetate-coenzyme A ligase PaaK-like adenylate-forming protein
MHWNRSVAAVCRPCGAGSIRVPGERIAFVGATGGHFASYVSVERLRRLQPWLAQTVRSFSIMQPLDALVAELNDFAPTVLASYPTAADVLGHEAEGRLALNLREIWTGGETLTAPCASRLESGVSRGQCAQQLRRLRVSGHGMGV